jgi:hypothetical protein
MRPEMSDLDMFKYGQLVAQVESLDKKVDQMDRDLKELLAIANKSKGGMFAGMMFVSAISTVVGYLTHYFLNK